MEGAIMNIREVLYVRVTAGLFTVLYPERGRRVYSAVDWRRNGVVAPRRKAIGLFSVMRLFGLSVSWSVSHVGQPAACAEYAFAARRIICRWSDCPVGGFCGARRAGAPGLLLNQRRRLRNALVCWRRYRESFLYAVPQIYTQPTVATRVHLDTTANDDIDAVDWRRRRWRQLFGVRRLATGHALAILVSFLSAPGWRRRFWMSADML